MFEALFREANAWSASRARMATGSNRPEAAPHSYTGEYIKSASVV